MAYLDNAATTYPKPDSVYQFMDSFYRSNGGSAGRGKYPLAFSSASLIEDTRQKIKRILRCPAKQVIFTPTATIALNMILFGLLSNSDRSEPKTVYITPFEHNAVTRPLHELEKIGKVIVKQLPVDQTFQYNLVKTEQIFLADPPDVVVMSHASNVIGLIAPVERIAYLAKQIGAVTVVDMAQTAGLVDLQTGLETIDFAVFAGHKTLYGPTGISGFVMNPKVQLLPCLYGGTGYDSINQDMPDSLPEKFEMGTLNISGIAGLHAALTWIEETGIPQLYKKELENRDRLLHLLRKYDFIEIVGPFASMDDTRQVDTVGIISFIVKGYSSEDIGSLLAEYGVSVRAGLQCAPLAHKFLRTLPSGTVRLSLSWFTCEKDFEDLEEVLQYISENI